MPVVLSQTNGKSSAIGLIIPPPELRNIIEKTASFVARNGKEFEEKINERESSNKKFNFLHTTDPYHKFYLKKIQDFREGIPAQQISNVQKKQLEILKKLTPKQFVPGKKPKDYEFIIEPPFVSPVDLDVMKLTAQFVARNGRRFLTDLMNREQRNPQFDFLRPQHAYFQYFAKLLEQYTKVFVPPKNIASNLRAEIKNPEMILENLKYHADWLSYGENQKKVKAQEAEKERLAYSAIDWHDFYVVETVDYHPFEIGNFPAPITPELIGTCLLNELRENDFDVEMEIVSDHEDQIEEQTEKSSELPKTLITMSDLTSDKITIKRYDPIAAHKRSSAGKSEECVISPLTGEKIPISKIDDHMRISLLDPRWIEERENVLKKSIEESVFSTGICKNLKSLAERRTDIFGSGNEETEIGKKIGEEGRKDNRVIWDGHLSSHETTSRAVQNNSKNYQNQVSNKNDQRQMEIPNLTSVFKQPVMQTINIPSPQIFMIPQLFPMVPPVNSSLISIMAPPPAISPIELQGKLPVELQNDEQPAAKIPCPDNKKLIPEDQFIKYHKSPIMIQVVVPNDTEKPEWNLNGQIISLNIQLSDNVLILKRKIQRETKMPPGKQKISYQGMFLKDNNSIAYYNMEDNSKINLNIKERGGRKK